MFGSVIPSMRLYRKKSYETQVKYTPYILVIPSIPATILKSLYLHIQTGSFLLGRPLKRGVMTELRRHSYTQLSC